MHLGEDSRAKGLIGSCGWTWLCVKLHTTQFSIYNVLKRAAAVGATPVQISCNRLVI